MLNQQRVIAAFEEKRTAFEEYAAARTEQSQTLDARIEAEISDLDAATIIRHLAGIEFPGAWPTPDYDRAAQLFRHPFARAWADHQAARGWAMDVLKERTTIAVDGSQITPTGDFFPPVGAIQIGWFVNDHCAGGRYVKDLEFAVLAPDELRDKDNGDGDESYAVQTVNQVRFVRECRRLGELMTQYATLPVDRRPVCFFDGSFIISFAGKISQPRAAEYIGAIQSLLDQAEALRVPLVGFVDNSRSRDVVMMVSHLLGRSGDVQINDGDLLAQHLPDWGDRSPLFVAARHDGLTSTGRGTFYADVCFCYMRLNRQRPPARIEIPRWLLEEGWADAVLDIVRGECVVGTGYPYAIETADALAVISAQDRQRFYALFQQFVDAAAIDFRQTRKAFSKTRRR